MELPDDLAPCEDPALDADLAELARVLDALPGFAARWPGMPYHARMSAASRWSGWMLLLDGLPLGCPLGVGLRAA